MKSNMWDNSQGMKVILLKANSFSLPILLCHDIDLRHYLHQNLVRVIVKSPGKSPKPWHYLFYDMQLFSSPPPARTPYIRG